MVELPTPDISHLTSADYEKVYEPAEDSFLLMDALEKDAEEIKSRKPHIAMEIGSGSGIVSTFLTQILGSSACYFCTDVNPHAAMVTQSTGAKNKKVLMPVLTDLASALSTRLAGSIDILLFNPPYVVTPSEEVGDHSIVASWAGGVKGREVMDRLFPQIPHLLSPSGVFYLLALKENDFVDIARIMQSHGFRMSLVLAKRFGPEHLSALKFTRFASDDSD